MSRVLDDEAQSRVLAARQMLARHADLELLLQIGEYKRGTDPESDRAILFAEQSRGFLRQRVGEPTEGFAGVHQRLAALLGKVVGKPA